MSALFFAEALLPQGWARDVRIGIEGEHIVAVAAGTHAQDGDERHALALPGIANLHSHAFQRGMAGLAETRGPTSDNFWTWREVMYRFANTVSPDDVEAIAAQVYVEMLEAGFTSVGEFHYVHHDRDGRPYGHVAEMAQRIAEAARETGIGLTLLPVFYAHANFGGAAPHDGQRRFICDRDLFARLVSESHRAIASLPGARLGIAPHSLRAVTPDELESVLPLAGDGPIHIHAAEQVKEVDDCLAWSRARPVEWLLDHAAIDRRWCLIHATHMNSDETRHLAASGAVAGLCPITEANLGDGIFNGPEFAAAGGRYGVGSDSNIFIGLADELRQLEYAQRLRQRLRNVMAAPQQGTSTGRTLYQGAVAGGAQALARGAAGLVPGARADIVSLNLAHPALGGRHADSALDTFIFAGGQHFVDCVWSGGRRLVAGGRHHRREAIAQRFRTVMQKLAAQ
jgi:formimidoylglutamate deiminase